VFQNNLCCIVGLSIFLDEGLTNSF